MRRGLCLAFVCLASCATTGSQVRIEELSDDLQMLRLSDHLWIHVSRDKTERWGIVPANGMLVLSDKDSLLIDTGWNPNQTRLIVKFAEEELKRPITRLIVTHAHGDRIGGLAALDPARVKVWAQELTAPVIVAAGFEVVSWVESTTIAVGQQTLELYYPGPGHTRDNSVVYIPEAKVLFGGCIVKSGASPDLGNREAAVLAAWPSAMLKLMDRYSAAELVVPGHGAPGGVGLLRHTLGLLEQELSQTTPN